MYMYTHVAAKTKTDLRATEAVCCSSGRSEASEGAPGHGLLQDAATLRVDGQRETAQSVAR